MEEVDPNVNDLSLAAFVGSSRAITPSYDVVLSVSVLEHVEDDGSFVRTVADLLVPGGTAILTVDFSNRYPTTARKPSLDQRLYTTTDIVGRLMAAVSDCGLIDVATWDDAEDDFNFDGCDYSFASWVFRKFDAGPLRHAPTQLAAPPSPAFVTPAPVDLLEALVGYGELFGAMGTLIGREETRDGTRLFTHDGGTPGYLMYGPYCPCSPGSYQCAFLIEVAATDIAGGTEVAIVDIALGGLPQGHIDLCRF